MKAQIITVILLVGFVLGAKAQNDLGVLGFQAWKSARIDEARGALERAQKDSAPTPAPKKRQGTVGGSRLQKSVRVDQKLEQAQLNLEIAQELTVNDYFVLYLRHFKQREAFIEAAKKLSPEEAADLMMSYQKQIGSPEPIELPNPNTAKGTAAMVGAVPN